MKPYSDSFLKHRTREELIDIIRCTAQNQQEAETALRQQYENTKYWVPVMHGHWEVAIGYDINRKVMCSECNRMNFEPSDFCPNCGAKMDETE